MPVQGMPVQSMPTPDTSAGFYSPVPQLEAMRGGTPTQGYFPSAQQAGRSSAGASGQGSVTMPGQLAPITDITQPQPMTTESLQYLNGFLKSQIGRRVHVEFLLGTNTMTDRTGTLLGVGANYILMRETDSDDLLVCDFYNIKFVTVYY